MDILWISERISGPIVSKSSLPLSLSLPFPSLPFPLPKLISTKTIWKSKVVNSNSNHLYSIHLFKKSNFQNLSFPPWISIWFLSRLVWEEEREGKGREEEREGKGRGKGREGKREWKWEGRFRDNWTWYSLWNSQYIHTLNFRILEPIFLQMTIFGLQIRFLQYWPFSPSWKLYY